MTAAQLAERYGISAERMRSHLVPLYIDGVIIRESRLKMRSDGQNGRSWYYFYDGKEFTRESGHIVVIDRRTGRRRTCS